MLLAFLVDPNKSSSSSNKEDFFTSVLATGLEDNLLPPNNESSSSPNRSDFFAGTADTGTAGAEIVGTGGADNEADAGLLDDPNNPPSSSPNRSDFFTGAAGTGAAGADCVGTGGAADCVGAGAGGADNEADAGLLDPNNPPSSSPNRSDFFAGAAGTGATGAEGTDLGAGAGAGEGTGAGAGEGTGTGGALLDPNNPPSSSPNRSDFFAVGAVSGATADESFKQIFNLTILFYF